MMLIELRMAGGYYETQNSYTCALLCRMLLRLCGLGSCLLMERIQ
jgi:hypothetical protein